MPRTVHNFEAPHQRFAQKTTANDATAHSTGIKKTLGLFKIANFWFHLHTDFSPTNRPKGDASQLYTPYN